MSVIISEIDGYIAITTVTQEVSIQDEAERLGGVVYDGEIFSFNKWQGNVIVKDVEAEKIHLFSLLREKRNQLLAETDWTANPDTTMTPEMTGYRQALRDLPATVDIYSPVYPTKP
jgi:hypothetical protein